MKYEWKYFFNIVIKYLSTHASEVKIDENIVVPLIELDFGDNFVLALEFRFREWFFSE